MEELKGIQCMFLGAEGRGLEASGGVCWLTALGISQKSGRFSGLAEPKVGSDSPSSQEAEVKLNANAA